MKKILIVSLGSIGTRHLRNTRFLLPESKIAILRLHHTQDTTVPHGADCVFTSSVAALEFKPDAVIVASPANEHVKNGLDFLSIGSNLFLEKPLSITTYDSNLKKLVELSLDAKAFSMVGYVLRFQPIIGYLRKILESSELGDIHSAQIEVGQYLPDWRPDSDYRKGASAQKKLGGGALLELSHELDYASWFFGFPKHLYCSARQLSALEIDVEDSATVIMEYEKKLRVTVQVDFLQRTPCMSLKAVCSKGTLYADLIHESARIVRENNMSRDLDIPKMANGNEMYLRQFDYFFGKSFNDYKMKYTDHDLYSEAVSVQRAAAVLKLVDVAKESSSCGKRLEFDVSEYE